MMEHNASSWSSNEAKIAPLQRDAEPMNHAATPSATSEAVGTRVFICGRGAKPNTQREDRSHIDFGHAISLLEVIEEDTRVYQAGNKFIAHSPRRSDSSPSLYIYPPGVGRYGHEGWTFHDYGGNDPNLPSSGKIIQYLKGYRGMTSKEAGAWCYRRVEGQGGDFSGHQRQMKQRPDPEPPRRINAGLQAEASETYLDVATTLFKSARNDLDTWLKDARGLDPAVFRRMGEGFLLSGDQGRALSEELAKSRKLDLLLTAGIMKEDDKGLRLFWRGPAAHLISTRYNGPMHVRARRTDFQQGDPWGKYLAQAGGNQSDHKNGGRTSDPVPFGEDLLQNASGGPRGPLLLFEGALDAVGATQLGLNAIGMGTRPGFGEHAIPITTVHGAWAFRHREALKKYDDVIVVPDADGGNKEQTGLNFARNLANYMKTLDVAASTRSMEDLQIEGFKDMAAYAAFKTYGKKTG